MKSVTRATVLELFQSQVRADAGAPALHYFGTTISRGELDYVSDALAAAFHRRGVEPGDRIAISLQNTPGFALSALAAFKVGAIVVPVNPTYRVRELAHVLRDSSARLLIADPALADTVAELPTGARAQEVLYSGGADLAAGEGPWRADEPRPAPQLLDVIAEHAGAAPRPLRETTRVALLTYTSGTTGPSKGAMNTHANVSYEIDAWRDWMALDERDVMLALAPLFHITGFIIHLSLSLATGMPLVLTYRFAAARAAALVERYRATVTIASITAYIALLDEPEAARFDMSSLEKVFSGGASVSAAVVERYERTFGPYIHNAYGLTETTSGTVAVPLGSRAPVESSSGALSIGVPLPGVSVTVRGDSGAELLPGEMGELIMRGPQVAEGYWRNEEETAAAFVDGSVHTGDVGFVDKEGWIYVVDRMKDIIVASGYKVWPRDVEDVLYEHPAVLEAAVVGAPDNYRGETVHAYISLRSGEEATPEELRAHCRERLAAYKCPSRIEIRADLPKTPSGKILRRELRAEAVTS